MTQNPWECNGDCDSLGEIPEREHKPDCPAILKGRIEKLMKLGVGLREAQIVLDGVKDTKALRRAQTYLDDGEFSAGRALTLAGNTGVGKSVAASYLVNKISIKKSAEMICAEDLQSIFFKDSRFNEIKKIHFLVVDDLGMEPHKVNEQTWFNSKLDALFYFRDRSLLPTVFTTNIKKDDFTETYDARIISRLRQWGLFVQIVDKDMRDSKNG